MTDLHFQTERCPSGEPLLLSWYRFARVQRELMEQPWWRFPPWTSQGKGGRLDAQDGRGSAVGISIHTIHTREVRHVK